MLEDVFSQESLDLHLICPTRKCVLYHFCVLKRSILDQLNAVMWTLCCLIVKGKKLKNES